MSVQPRVQWGEPEGTDAKYKVGVTVLVGDIECVIVYKANSEQSWGQYILCEKHDLHYYQPELGTGGVDEFYAGKIWGGTSADDTEANGTAIGTGKDNTDYLISKYTTFSYLWYHVNKHRTLTGKQWHVPSKDELEILGENSDLIGEIPASPNDNYWSSSERSTVEAWTRHLGADFEDFTQKNDEFSRVRCVLYATQMQMYSYPIVGDQSVPIEITCATEGAEIRYTTDGSEPTEQSTLYTGQFEVTPPATVKARGYKDGMLASDVASYEVEGGTEVTKLPTPRPYVYEAGHREYHYGLSNASDYPEGSIFHFKNSESDSWTEVLVSSLPYIGGYPTLICYVSCEGYEDSDIVTDS